MARNSGFFYAMLQGSMLVGNLFAYFQFRGLDSIDRVTRLQTIGGLFASTIAGCLLFILLLPRTSLRAVLPVFVPYRRDISCSSRPQAR